MTVVRELRPNLRRRILRRFLLWSESNPVFGFPGRKFGRRIGWRLSFGPRIIIDSPKEFMQSEMLARGVYEPNIAFLISSLLRPGDAFIDVGANAGQHSLIAAHSGATVHSFEPVPRLAQRVRDNARLNRFYERITVHEMALGASSDVAEIYVANRSDDGSHSLVPGIPAKDIASLAIRVEPLDELVEAKVVPSPDLMKIDVEGVECKVLDGACRTISGPHAPLVIVETSDALASKLGESTRSVLSRLTDRGYIVYRIPDRRRQLELCGPESLDGAMANYLAVPPTRAGALNVAELVLPG